MKYNPYTHIIGKVYDLTQENMNALLDEIDRLNQEYDAALMALNIANKENARYREALEYYANRMGMGGTAREALKGE